MIRTGRFSLTTTPQQVDTYGDDSTPGRAVAIIAQGTGTLVICEDVDGYATGARILVTAGQGISFEDITDDEEVWVASTPALDIDVIYAGVA